LLGPIKIIQLKLFTYRSAFLQLGDELDGGVSEGDSLADAVAQFADDREEEFV
jgi:hypothetical protein